MNIILILQEEINKAGLVTVTDQRAIHIRKVLKCGIGDTIRVGMLHGGTGEARIESLSPEGVTLACAIAENPPACPAVDLLLAMPRPKILKRLWAPLAALGVGRIFITNAKKVERNYFDTHVLGEPFIVQRLLEGLQQCGDTRLPEVSIHRRLKVLLEDELDQYAGDAHRLIAHPRVGRRIAETIDKDQKKRVLLAIGPEGGWTDYELEMFHDCGFSEVTMGSRVLRSDTACIALVSLVHDVLQRPTGC